MAACNGRAALRERNSIGCHETASRLARDSAGPSHRVVLLVALVALRVWDPPPIEEMRLRSFDFYQVLKPRDAKLRPVVIVDIDEASLQGIGQWPWPRTLVADLVTQTDRARRRRDRL